MTWYSRTASSSLILAGSRRWANVAAGILAKASLVGAKTVKGPVPERAVVRLPATRAVTRVERSGTDWASCTIFLEPGEGPGEGPAGGMRTASMMWTTPLVAAL